MASSMRSSEQKAHGAVVGAQRALRRSSTPAGKLVGSESIDVVRLALVYSSSLRVDALASVDDGVEDVPAELVVAERRVASGQLNELDRAELVDSLALVARRSRRSRR